MPIFFPDTNILIDFGRNPEVRERLEKALSAGAKFVIAPPMLIELTRGLVKAGREHFKNNQQAYAWLYKHGFEILPLPSPFIANLLKSSLKEPSGVEPNHYREQIEMISSSSDFDDFLKKAEGTVWADLAKADGIHEAELDKEFSAMSSLARGRAGHGYAELISRKFGNPESRPSAAKIAETFSAAIEFLEASINKVRGGSIPRKNDPGLYTDFQLLFYLGDPNLAFLTSENFAHEITKSPQRDRILNLDTLR
jgi:hypothetical protein